MTTTYDCIATTTVGSSTATIDFTSIPSTFTDLILVLTAKVSAATDVWIRANNDSATNYSYTVLYAHSGGVGTARDINSDRGFLTDYYGLPADNDNSHVCIAHFMNYSNTTTWKTMIARSNRANSGVDLNCAMWRSTSAINRLTLRFSGAQTFDIGTIATLYGIKQE